MSKFSYNDIVTAKPDAPKELRPGERAWVVGIIEQEGRKDDFLKEFPEGIVYTIEFEDGLSVEAKESDLLLNTA